MTSIGELDASRYLDALKELLKERGVTYAHLATALDVSLPTVKRALNKPSTPLSRLLEMCAVAGIAIDDLHIRAERLRPSHFVFTEEQDRVFAEHPEVLTYFLELGTRRRTPVEIAEHHDLDLRSSERYLDTLSQLGLIEWRGGLRARLLVRPPFGFGPASRVLRRQQREFMQTIVSTVLSDTDPPTRECVLVLKPLTLTTEDYGRMVEEVVSVIDRYAAVSERPLVEPSLRPWQIAAAAGPAPDAAPPVIPRLT